MTPAQASAIAAIDACVVALAESARVLRESLADVAPPPIDPLPPPVPSTVHRRTLNPAHILMLTEWLEGGGAYDRDDKLLLWSGDTATVQVRAWSPHAGDIAFLAPRYRLTLNGKPAATADVAPGSKLVTFTVALDDLSGWQQIEIEPAIPTSETCVPGFAYVGTEPSATMPALEGTHTLKGNGYTAVQWAWVPAKWQPVTVPYAHAPRPAFDAPLTRRNLVQTDIAPHRPGDVYRTRLTGSVLNTEQTQSYYWSTLASNEFPAGIAVLDGLRGCGTVTMATHLQIGRNGGAYFCDPWRLAHITPEGTVRTLAGWRHRQPAERPLQNTREAMRASVELVGDWSAVPADRHGFHEAWGMAWDARTLVIDEASAAVPNPPNGDEKTHVTGPVCFIADSQRKRICRLEFDPRSHASPAKVTEFITGLDDPWDCVCVDGVLYVSERMAHRIAAYDATSGAYLRTVVGGAALSRLTSVRSITRTGTEAQIKAEPCVGPEGLYHLDGWLYFGSWSQATIRRVNLTSGVIETIVDMPFDSVAISGGNFFKIAVSDGTFGPRGSVFMVSWALTLGGFPTAWLPDGTRWNYGGLGAEGPGQVWDTKGYGSSVAVGQGRMIFSTSAEGLHDVYQAPTGTPVARWADQERRRKAYEAEGLHLTHGPGGWGYYGLPLPWGKSQDIDDHLIASGHTKG